MSDIPIRLNIKGDPKPGASLQVALLIGHPMESGFRALDSGERAPKNVIERIELRLNGALVWTAHTGIGMPAHPYFGFALQLPAEPSPGGYVLSARWWDDRGAQGAIERRLLGA